MELDYNPDLDVQFVYDEAMLLLSTHNVSKLYLTVQHCNILNDEHYRVHSLEHESYTYLTARYGYNPIFTIIVNRNDTLEEFADNLQLTPLWDIEEGNTQYILCYLDVDNVGRSVECYSTRWGDYHEITSNYLGNEYYSDLSDAMQYYISRGFETQEKIDEMSDIDTYIKTTYCNTRPDMSIVESIHTTEMLAYRYI